MHSFFNIQLLTAFAVFVHLGAALASMLMKDKTDQKKIAEITTKTDQAVSLLSAVAPAIPQTAPKTIPQIASDLAAVSAALATALAAPTILAAAAAPTGGTS